MRKPCVTTLLKTTVLILFAQLVIIHQNKQNFITNFDKYVNSEEIYKNLSTYFTENPTTSKPEEKSTTIILMWTKYYQGIEDETLLKNIRYGTNWYKGCCSGPVCCTDSDILITKNRELLPKATAVVFFHYAGNLRFNDLPPTRTPEQLWVLFTVESPKFTIGLDKFSKLFNLTMGYRRDSDIYSPYGYKVPLDNPLSSTDPIIMPGGVPLDKWIARKTKPLAAAITNCDTYSKREVLTKSLVNSTLHMHLYGGCGKYQICGRLDLACNQTEAWMKIGKRYKFFFAAENSLCEDYITEKFWRTLQIGMVPLVFGGANYTAVAPPNSFIDAMQFDSMPDLVKHLTWLSENPSEYAKYFEWRRQYDVKKTDCWHGWCELCKRAKKLHNDSKSVAVKYHDDLHSWFWKPRKGNKRFKVCANPHFFISKFMTEKET